MLLNGYVVCKVMESYKKKTALKDKIGLNCWVLIEKRKRCGFRRKTPASSVHTVSECYQHFCGYILQTIGIVGICWSTARSNLD